MVPPTTWTSWSSPSKWELRVSACTCRALQRAAQTYRPGFPAPAQNDRILNIGWRFSARIAAPAIFSRPEVEALSSHELAQYRRQPRPSRQGCERKFLLSESGTDLGESVSSLAGASSRRRSARAVKPGRKPGAMLHFGSPFRILGAQGWDLGRRLAPRIVPSSRGADSESFERGPRDRTWDLESRPPRAPRRELRPTPSLGRPCRSELSNHLAPDFGPLSCQPLLDPEEEPPGAPPHPARKA